MAKNYGKKSKKNRKNFKVKTNINAASLDKVETLDAAKATGGSSSSITDNASSAAKKQAKGGNVAKSTKALASTDDGINNIDFIKKDLRLMAKSVIVVILIFIGCYYYLASSAGQKLIENMKL